MSKKPPSTDNRKKKFVYMQQDYTLAFGQVKNKHQTGKHMIQYWVTVNNMQRTDSETPYKVIK
jgi:hypothetical protein